MNILPRFHEQIGPVGASGMERSFADDVVKLTLGDGDVFEGEAILAITKALLQSGVAYVGGYPGAPVSHLMDVLAESRDRVLEPLGVQFEQSASEAGAAALLGASIHYPLRGAVTWKSIVGTNVASDALSNLASAGVTGGALIVVGEDYGEGASVIQERTHATALKSSIPLIDPRYHMPTLVRLTEEAFDLSEACHLPVIMSIRIRAAHMTGSFVAKDNRPPPWSARNPLPAAQYDYGRIVLPPSTYAQEKAKIEERLPAARRFIVEHSLNEEHPGDGRPLGIILQGGAYGVVLRALRLLGAAGAYGDTPVPLLILNVIHPLVPDQVAAFLDGKRTVLVVEEGNPAFIEQQIRSLAQERGLDVRVHGKDVLPEAGEYTGDVVRAGLAAWLEDADPALGPEAKRRLGEVQDGVKAARAMLETPPPPRPPGFCTGCPERPVFTALKLLQRERGPLHISSDIGCNTFATLPPFNMGSTVLGYGMSLASGGAVGPALNQSSVAVMGDGGFWHNGLATGAVNAQWNGHDSVLIILENGYASATGQQHVPSTGSTPWGRKVQVSIERTLRAIGVPWLRRVDAYDVGRTLRILRQALDRRGQGVRVVISDAECALAKGRRRRKLDAERAKAGLPTRKERYGVDEEVCVGDHSCMRLNGCPSLTLRPARDPLKDAPTATVAPDCVACDLCGQVAQAAKLCPSFYKASTTVQPNRWQSLRARLNRRLLAAVGAS
ncbi:MAG: indolepyruvate ferredoxin oxidoreductase subunit alpha [Rhodospirillales bacterium]|nr:indolepyruvate ferredoxin oxidoreductase subunit alpha [Rhodospirillales bacterium]